MVKWTNAGGQTKRANERSFVYRPPAWQRWRNVKTTYCSHQPPISLLCVPNQNRHAIDHFVSKITWIIERQSYKNALLLACASCVMVTPLHDYRFLNKGWMKVRAAWIWTIQRKFVSHFSVGSKAARDIICQKRVRVFHQGFQTRQTPRNRWKHEAAGRVLLLFRGVLKPWWNTKHEFLTWLLKLVQEFSEIISVELVIRRRA